MFSSKQSMYTLAAYAVWDEYRVDSYLSRFISIDDSWISNRIRVNSSMQKNTGYNKQFDVPLKESMIIAPSQIQRPPS